MIYVLEFFAEDIENENCPRLKIKHRAKTLALVEKHARGLIKDVSVGDKKACGCLIKDQLGKLISGGSGRAFYVAIKSSAITDRAKVCAYSRPGAGSRIMRQPARCAPSAALHEGKRRRTRVELSL